VKFAGILWIPQLQVLRIQTLPSNQGQQQQPSIVSQHTTQCSIWATCSTCNCVVTFLVIIVHMQWSHWW